VNGGGRSRPTTEQVGPPEWSLAMRPWRWRPADTPSLPCTRSSLPRHPPPTHTLSTGVHPGPRRQRPAAGRLVASQPGITLANPLGSARRTRRQVPLRDCAPAAEHARRARTARRQRLRPLAQGRGAGRKRSRPLPQPRPVIHAGAPPSVARQGVNRDALPDSVTHAPTRRERAQEADTTTRRT
jgi:hypothetical protein